MNQQQAKRILLAARLEVDGSDPDVRAALELAQHDAALAEWWTHQQEVQAELRKKFHEIPVPAGLKEQLMAGRKIVRPEWWRSTWARVAAVAAVLVALLAVITRHPDSSEATFDQFRERMVRMVVREYRMDITTTSEGQIKKFLAEKPGQPDYRLPEGMTDLPLFGAGRLAWQGNKVSMICFQPRPKVLMYLFVVKRSVIPNPPGRQPEFGNVARRPTASWSDADQVYVLASETDLAELRSLFK